MTSLIRRYGFAAAVVGVVAAMALVVLARSLWPDGQSAAAPGAQTAPRGPGAGREIAMVQVRRLQREEMSDAIQALGTAQARESVVITPETADTIRRILFESGQRVRRGQVLVEMTNVEQEADLAEAVAANRAAQEELRRFETLFERGFASSARLDAARAGAAAAQAREAAGRARVADRTLRAPFSGVMGLRTASPGQLMQPGAAISTLDDLQEIKLDFDVPENQIARLAPGMAITARTAAFPDEAFTGRIAQIDSRVSPATRTLRVRALLPNPQERLRPGMLMTVEVRANQRSALLAPEPAIIEDAQGPFAFVVVRNGPRMSVERRPVRTGRRANGMVEILEGLNEGEDVVTEGVQRVRPGQPVRLAPSNSVGAG